MNRYDHVTPALKQLHWLPVRERIVFKILVMTFKCLHDPDYPSYLRDFISISDPEHRPIRTVNSSLINVPFTRSSYVQNTVFSHNAPLLWNHLPLHVRSSPSLPVFKARLKTHLFSQYYHWNFFFLKCIAFRALSFVDFYAFIKINFIIIIIINYVCFFPLSRV